jgi:hypothetical protein
MLYLATLGLSVPIVVRGVLDIVRHFDEDLKELLEYTYPLTFNILFYIFCDLLPLLF